MNTKKILALILSAMIIFTALPAHSLADNPAFARGDVDRDGMVTVIDARSVLRIAMGLDGYDDEQAVLADINNDGSIKVADSRIILRIVLEIDSAEEYTLPGEEIAEKPDEEPTEDAGEESDVLMTITSDKSDVVVGDTFTITVYANNFSAEGIAAFQADIKYDTSLVKLVGDITKVSARDGGLEGIIEGAEIKEGHIAYGGITPNYFQYDSYSCFTATFEAIAEGEAVFDFVGGKKFEFFDESNNKKIATAEGCRIVVSENSNEEPTEPANKTEGYLTYEVSNGEATITGCDRDISGKLEIPATLGGYPVTEIGSLAFNELTELTEIMISASVTNINENSFNICSGIESIVVNDNNTKYYSSDNCLIERETNTLILGCRNSIIPDSVTKIGNHAFDGCTGLTKIKIPASVANIGSFAFAFCPDLTEIKIPASVTNIDGNPFAGCSGLELIEVDGNNPKYYSSGDCLIERETNTLISGCKNSIIPDFVTAIAGFEEFGGAFYGCTSLTKITIPNSVMSIGSYVFAYCTGLNEITLSDSLATIGEYAFEACTGLTEVIIPDSVIEIAPKAFGYCEGLTEITIGDSVKRIGDQAFLCCTGLTEITIPDSVTEIEFCAFAHCQGLTKITIPDSVTEIGGGAFLQCIALTDVYYTGTEEDWNNKNLGEAFNGLESVTVHYNFVPAEKPTDKPSETPTEVIKSEFNKLPIKVKVSKEHIQIAKGLTVEQTKTTFKEFIVNILDINGNKLEDDAVIGTGAVIEIYDGEKIVEKKVVVFKGDINGDGQVKTTDARNALRASLGLDTLQDVQTLAADVNNDGTLKATDARAILRGAMGLDETDAWLG